MTEFVYPRFYISFQKVWGFKWGLEGTKLSYKMSAAWPLVNPQLGEDDLDYREYELAMKLIAAGPEHCKFMRSIIVWAKIRAARYWWQEFDTYKIGTVAMSESTIHLLTKTTLTNENFSYDMPRSILNEINNTETLIQKKALLPESFLQTRAVCMNYQTLRTICHQRSHHKLREWQMFIEAVSKNLRYPEFLLENV